MEGGSEGSELTGELRDGVRFGLGLVFADEGVELLLERLKLRLEGADVDGASGIARLAFCLVRDGGARARWRGDGSCVVLGNRSGSAPVPKAGAGVRDEESPRRKEVHLRRAGCR